MLGKLQGFDLRRIKKLILRNRTGSHRGSKYSTIGDSVSRKRALGEGTENKEQVANVFNS
jgi:hypothetical protein